MRPARVLWVTASPPDHDGTGAQLRQAVLLAAVASRAPVLLVAAGRVTDARVREAAAEVVEVPGRRPPEFARPLGRRLRLVRHLLTDRVPWETALARDQRAALVPALDRLVRPDDAVLVEHLELAPLARHLEAAGRRVLTIHHAAGHQATQQLALATTARGRRWWRVQRRRVHALERWVDRAYDAVVTVSELDAAAVACASVVVPNAVRLPGPATPPRRTRRVVFTGTLDYEPNRDGICWFARTAWADVRRAVPDATLQVVGRAPGPEVRELGDLPGVQVHPDVDEVMPWLEGAEVTVVPLRLGGGTRLKALQAMAAGRPVVGTPTGLEGLGLRDGVHALVAGTPAELAAAVVSILQDEQLRDRLAAGGRAHVAATHDGEAAGSRLAAVLGLQP